MKTVCGVGITGNTPTIDENGVTLKSYTVWQNMLLRCYNENRHNIQPTYQLCTVHTDWHRYETFKQWFNTHYREGYQLDKDILCRNNSCYSPDTCCLVPREINALIRSSNKSRGNTPIGVNFNKKRKKYHSHISINGFVKHLGSFDTPEEAFGVYKIAREQYIKDMATKYFENSMISLNVMNALHNWTVDIND